jgi:hypothetical protein
MLIQEFFLHCMQEGQLQLCYFLSICKKRS